MLWLQIEAQQQIKRDLKPFLNSSSRQLASNGKSFFMAIDSCAFFYSLCSEQYLYKINVALQTVDSLHVSKWLNANNQLLTDYQIFTRIGYNSFDDLVYLSVLRFWRNGLNDEWYHTLIRVDTNLVFQDSLNIYPQSLNYATAVKDWHFEKSSFVVSGQKVNSGVASVIMKMKNTLQINFDSIYLGQDILPPPFNSNLFFGEISRYQNAYILTQHAFGPPVSYFILDTNFHITDTRSFGYQHSIAEYGIHQIVFTDTTATPKIISIVGQLFWPPINAAYNQLSHEHRYLGMFSLDSNLNVSQIDTFAFSWDTRHTIDTVFSYLPSLFGKTVAFNHSDSLLIGGSEIYKPDFFYTKFANNTYLHLINPSTGSTHWSRVYKDGNHQDLLHVEAVKSGNFLLMFNVMDLSLNQENQHITLIIVDNQGNPIGLPKEEQFSEKPGIYPNPVAAGGLVNLTGMQASKTYNYYINATNGQTVQQGKIVDEPSINISQLPAGIYTLSITNTHGWGWATKLVVE